MTENKIVTPEMAERETELNERQREYQRQYRLKKYGEPVKKEPLTEEEKALKKEKMREYQRQYRTINKEKCKEAITQWRVKNADKIKEERQNNKAKYAAIQRAYDHKMKDDPHYLALYDARQKRYLERKKINPELYKQKPQTEPNKKGRPKTRGVVKAEVN